MIRCRRLGLFFRTWAPGFAKTRLTPLLTADEAAWLYRAFLRDIVRSCRAISGVDLVLFHTGAPLPDLPPEMEGLPVRPQQGGSLGDRMNRALLSLLEEPGALGILIGSDCPGLPAERIGEAFSALESTDLVIGPCPDGGYYLVGVRAPRPALFQDIDWGKQTVLESTLTRAAGLRTVQLEPWSDIDTPADLGRFLRLLEAHPEVRDRARSTLEAVMQLDPLKVDTLKQL